MLACNQVVNDSPTMCDEATRELRYRLIGEELAELLDACVRKDLPDIADAIGDLLYVLAGSYVSHGLEMPESENEVEGPILMTDQWSEPFENAFWAVFRYGNRIKQEHPTSYVQLDLDKITKHVHRISWWFGFDIEPILDLIHEANMKKLTGPKDAAGKQLKPEGWTPPDIAGELVRQGWSN